MSLDQMLVRNPARLSGDCTPSWPASPVTAGGREHTIGAYVTGVLSTVPSCGPRRQVSSGTRAGRRRGFVVLQPLDGENIQQVLGANQLGYDSGYQYLVRVTGYPSSAGTPITCVNWTSRQSATQLRFNCGGYTGGTSGSPWVTRFDPRSRTGTIVGVIGGYEEGGDTPSVSYSAYLGDGVRQLYQQAISAGTSGGQVQVQVPLSGTGAADPGRHLVSGMPAAGLAAAEAEPQ